MILTTIDHQWIKSYECLPQPPRHPGLRRAQLHPVLRPVNAQDLPNGRSTGKTKKQWEVTGQTGFQKEIHGCLRDFSWDLNGI